jgi:hypothetical protein
MSKRPRQFEASRRQRVIQLYRAKLPVAAIAERCAVSPAYVSKTATEEGINRRPQDPLRRPRAEV